MKTKTDESPKDPLTGAVLERPAGRKAVDDVEPEAEPRKVAYLHPFRVRACFVLRGMVVSSYEGHETLKGAQASAKAVKAWRQRAPSASGATMQLSQLDVDKLVGHIYKLQERTAIKADKEDQPKAKRSKA